MTEIVQRSSII